MDCQFCQNAWSHKRDKLLSSFLPQLEMARAGPSRSQRAPQPTQSQPRPTNGRRSSRAQQNNDEDEEQEEGGEEEDEDEPEDVDMDANGANKGDELTRKANDLVRLALFTEHKRTPLKRDEINKKGSSIILGDRLTILILGGEKVLGTNARSFNTVFEQAQKILRKTFGMELVELRSRAEIYAEGNADGGGGKDDDLEDARKAAGVKKKGNYPPRNR